MLNPHAKLGIAETVFYVPVVLLAAYLFFYRHAHNPRPRFAWYVLTLFSLIRLAGGIVVVLYENDQSNAGLLVASLILLNVGVFPIIASTSGFIVIILHDTQYKLRYEQLIRRGILLMRILFIIGIALIIGGGVRVGVSGNSNDVAIGDDLVKAGYIVIVVFVLSLFLLLAFLWLQASTFPATARKFLIAASSAMPFFAVRLVYALLSVFATSTTEWSPLTGSIAPFVIMALLMEYFVVCIYIFTGFHVPAGRNDRVSDRTIDQGTEIA